MKATLTALGDVAVVGGFRERFQAEPADRVIDPDLIHLLCRSDSCIANIECVLTESRDFTIPGYGLQTPPFVAAILRSLGINIGTLANNHIRDVGDVGVIDTIRHLQSAGIKVCGAGENSHAASATLHFSVGGMRFGLLAVAEREDNLASDQRAGADAFQPETWTGQIMALRKECDVVLVSVHAGHEFAKVPSPRIRTAYRQAVDAGAHIVLGHHPHVVQGIERRNGGVIFYSLGNFCFDSNYVCGYPGWEIGIVPEITFAEGEIEFVVHPIRIRRGESVQLLKEGEKAAFLEKLDHLSELIGDDTALDQAWKEHVEWRFEQDYLPNLLSFGERMNSKECERYARYYRNIFLCPTHQELIGEYLASRMERR